MNARICSIDRSPEAEAARGKPAVPATAADEAGIKATVAAEAADKPTPRKA